MPVSAEDVLVKLRAIGDTAGIERFKAQLAALGTEGDKSAFSWAGHQSFCRCAM
jgi:hypothetical protein